MIFENINNRIFELIVSIYNKNRLFTDFSDSVLTKLFVGFGGCGRIEAVHGTESARGPLGCGNPNVDEPF